MNFVFVSPHFPRTYYNFAQKLKNKGVNTLGIGDCPYDGLSQEVKDALNEYYYVTSMEDYDQMYRAVAYFAFKYGKIDWLESNNEYWLELDAQLRTDFNIETGAKNDFIAKIKCKSQMKASYEKAGVPVARYHLTNTLENGLKFAKEVGFPIIAKPDNGCGAEGTYKFTNEEELKAFYDLEHDTQYIMEEFINGTIESFDGIAGPDAVPLFYTSNYFPVPIMDVVKNNTGLAYWTVKDVPADLKDAGFRTIKAFGARNRFFHLEFFRLNEDKPGMGKKGDIVALEVNMRPAGGYTPDMINFANSVDCYELWAQMVTEGKCYLDEKQKKHYCVYASQRDENKYKHTSEEITEKYKDVIKMHERMPEALAKDMGNEMWTVTLDTKKELDAFVKYVQETKK